MAEKRTENVLPRALFSRAMLRMNLLNDQKALRRRFRRSHALQCKLGKIRLSYLKAHVLQVILSHFSDVNILPRER